jgi:hypothetical protein
MLYPAETRAILAVACILLVTPICASAVSIPGCISAGMSGTQLCDVTSSEPSLLLSFTPDDFGDVADWDESAAMRFDNHSAATADESMGLSWFIGSVLLLGGLIRYFTSDTWVDYVRRLYLEY